MQGETQDLFAVAHERAETGMQRAAEHADRVSPGWTDLAVAMLCREVGVRADKFTIEQVRAVIEPQLEKPTDLRAWGRVTQSAIKLGVIVKTGEFAPAASSNGSPKPLYRRGGTA